MAAANLPLHGFRRTQMKITPFVFTNGILELPHFLADFAHATTHRSVGGINLPVVSAVVHAILSNYLVALKAYYA